MQSHRASVLAYVSSPLWLWTQLCSSETFNHFHAPFFTWTSPPDSVGRADIPWPHGHKPRWLWRCSHDVKCHLFLVWCNKVVPFKKFNSEPINDSHCLTCVHWQVISLPTVDPCVKSLTRPSEVDGNCCVSHGWHTYKCASVRKWLVLKNVFLHTLVKSHTDQNKQAHSVFSEEFKVH